MPAGMPALPGAMEIRGYEERDLAALKEIHARQGFGYAFPDLGTPLFLTKLVLGREEGGKGIVGASCCG